jgi:hypothetical protein
MTRRARGKVTKRELAVEPVMDSVRGGMQEDGTFNRGDVVVAAYRDFVVGFRAPAVELVSNMGVTVHAIIAGRLR